VVDGKYSIQSKLHNIINLNDQNSYEENGVHFPPLSRLSNLEEDPWDSKEVGNILDKEHDQLIGIISKLDLIPCDKCLKKLDKARNLSSFLFQKKTHFGLKSSQAKIKKHFKNLQSRYSEYKNSIKKSLYSNIGLCIELEKKFLFGSLLKLEDKILAESLMEIKAVTEFSKLLVEFKGSHLVFPFSMKEIMRLNSYRSKCLFQIHIQKSTNKPFSFSASLNKMNSLESLPENINVKDIPKSIMIFRNYYSKPLWQKWKLFRKNNSLTNELDFTRFCLNSRNYSRVVEQRDTLHSEKQARKSKVRTYKGVTTPIQPIFKKIQIQDVVFTCHHCSYRGPKKHFLECYQKNFFTRLDPGEELLKVFFNLKSNIHMYCEKVYCKECIENFYPEDNSKKTDFKNWICPFCREKCYCTLCEHRDLYFKMHDLFLSLGGECESLKRHSPIQKIIDFYLNNSFYDMKFELEEFSYVRQFSDSKENSTNIQELLRNSKKVYKYKTTKKKKSVSKNLEDTEELIHLSDKFNLKLFKNTSNTIININIDILDRMAKIKGRKKYTKKLFISTYKQFLEQCLNGFIKNPEKILFLLSDKITEQIISVKKIPRSLPRIHMTCFDWKKGFLNYLSYCSPFKDSIRFKKYILSEDQREYDRLCKETDIVYFPKPYKISSMKELRLITKFRNQLADLYSLIQLVKEREETKCRLYESEFSNL
jgi:hypothetical protein